MTGLCTLALLAAAFLEAQPPPAGCSAAVQALFAEAAAEKAERRWSDEGAEIWRRPLRRGAWAFLLRNNGNRAAAIDLVWKEHGLRGSPRVYDVLRERDRGKVHGGFAERVEPGGVSLFRVTP